MIDCLSNLLAVQEPEAEARNDLAAALRACGRFHRVEDTGTGWLVGTSDLPGSCAPPPAVPKAGLWFAEGRDVWQASAGTDEAVWRDYADLAQHRPESLHELPGDFTFLHFGKEEVTAVRSVCGLVPLYWWKTRGRWALATCFEDIALKSVVPDDTEPDLLSCLIRAHGGYYFVDNRTPLRAVRCVPPAAFIRLRPGPPAEARRYWLAPRLVRKLPSEEERQATLTRFRNLLLKEIDRQIDPGQPNLVSLSGGVDSGALCYILKRRLNARLWALSMTLTKDLSHQRDLSFINPVLYDCGIERAWTIDWNEANLLRDIAKPPTRLWASLWAYAGVVDELPQSLRPLTFITGGFADQICGGSYTHPDWTRTLKFRQMMKIWRQWPDGWRAPARWFKHRLRDTLFGVMLDQDCGLGHYVSLDLRREHQAALKRAWTAAATECPERPYLRMDWELHAVGRQMHWNFLSPLGIRPVVPFLSRGLIELAMQTHPTLQIGPGLKRLLRESLADLVAERTLSRTDKGLLRTNFSAQVPYAPPALGWSAATARLVPAMAARFASLDIPGKRVLLGLDCVLRSLDSKLNQSVYVHEAQSEQGKQSN